MGHLPEELPVGDKDPPGRRETQLRHLFLRAGFVKGESPSPAFVTTMIATITAIILAKVYISI